MLFNHDNLPKLPDDTRAATRDEILFTLQFALGSSRYRLTYGNDGAHSLRAAQEERRQSLAKHILDHLELSNYRLGKGPPIGQRRA